jgi:hypothetical protein
MQHSKALLRDTIQFSEKSTVALTVWSVKKDERFPDGFKYSFVFLFENKRILAYDNHEGKGHHRHYKNQSEAKNPHLQEIKTINEIQRLKRIFLEETRKLCEELGDLKKKRD